MNQSFLKAFTRYLIITLLTGVIITIGGYGEYLVTKEDTSPGWNLFGLFLFTLIIIVPSATFWTKTLIDLFTDDEV